jgi:hypothetical protein
MGVAYVQALKFSANSAERAYLAYAGRLIFEEATRQLGVPKTLKIGIEYDDLDVAKVSSDLLAAYPVYPSDGMAARQLH